jgi:hypothetical protein
MSWRERYQAWADRHSWRGWQDVPLLVFALLAVVPFYAFCAFLIFLHWPWR